MKKKVLYGVAMALVAGVGMGTLQSCKDDLSDAINQVNYDRQTDYKKLMSLLDDLNGRLTTAKSDCQQNIDALKVELEGKLKELKDTHTGDIEKINRQIQDILKQMMGLGADQSISDYVQDQINELKEDIKDGTIIVGGGGCSCDIPKIEAAIQSIHDALDLLSTDVKNQFKDVNDKLGVFSDDLTQLKAQYQAQQKVIDDLNTELDNLWKDVFGDGGLSDQLSQVYNALKDEINSINDKYDELASQNTELWEAIYAPGGLSDQMSQYYQANKEAIDKLTDDQTELWESIFATGGLSDQMSQYYQANKAAIEENAASTKELWESVFGEGGIMELMSMYYNANLAEIEALKATDEELWLSLYGPGGIQEQMSMYYNANQAEIEELKAADEELWLALYGPDGIQEQMTMFYNANQNAISELADQVETMLNGIINRFDNLITGILLQGVYSPVFGSVNLPFDVQSNILFNWCGYNDLETYNFPNAGSEYNYKDEAPALTFADLAALSPKLVELKKGYFGDLNLGKVYMTINPAGHYFDEKAFKLETSSEKALPATLKVSKSNDELVFGYTRATVEGNGFYAADVVVNENDIPKVEIVIDPGLKSSVKSALKDLSALRDRSKFSSFAVDFVKGLYNQFRNFPAYAVRYDWSVNDQPYSVIGKYDILATTAKPFSYQMLVDGGYGSKLPIYNNIENIIYKLKDNENLKFDFTKYGLSFDDGKYEINIKPLVIDDKSVTVTGGSLTVQIPEITVYQNINGEKIEVGKADPTPVTVEGNDLNNLYTSIEKGIKDAINSMTQDISGWTTDLSDEVNSKVNDMLSDVQSKLNKALKEIGDDITGRVENILDDLGEQAQPYFDRLNKLIDLYNRVAGKINRFLSTPNHYLQVAMFYTQNDSNLGLVSNSLNSPTMFNKGNNNGWIGLYASSYTAELLAPAYMKYVAITNVYDAKTKKPVSADLKALNAKGKCLNKVVDGKTLRFGISADSLEPNKIYEIVYQGVDYQARTSTQKFYIQVK